MNILGNCLLNKPRYRLLLIAIFVIFVLNFGKAFGYDAVLTTESSPSRSPHIVQIINIPEEVKIIGISSLRSTIQNGLKEKNSPYGLLVELTNRSCGMFTTFDESFFDKWIFITKGQMNRKWFFEFFERQIAFLDSCGASADVVYETLNFPRLSVGIDFGYGYGVMNQINRVHSELWSMSSDKQLPIGAIQKKSEYGDGYRSQSDEYNANDIYKIIVRRTLIYILSLFAAVWVSHFAYNYLRDGRRTLGAILIGAAFAVGSCGGGLLIASAFPWSWGWFL